MKKRIKITALLLTFILLVCNLSTTITYAAPVVEEALKEAKIKEETELTQRILDDVNANKLFEDGTIIRLKNANSGKYLELMDRNLAQNTLNPNSYAQRFKLSFIEQYQAYSITPVSYEGRQIMGLMEGNANIFDFATPNPFYSWNIYEVEDGKIKILNNGKPNLCLSTYGLGNGSSTGTSMTSDGNAIISNYTADESQHWYFELVDSTQYFQDNAVYSLKNVASNKYLDVAGAQDVVGANIIQYTKGTGENQKFRFEYDKYSGHYKIRSKISTNGYGNVIGKNTSSPNIQINAYNYETDDKWFFTKISDGRYKIALKSNPNMVLTSYGTNDGSTTGTGVTSAGNVFVSTFTGSTNQLWTVEKVALPDRIALPDSKAASFDKNNITAVESSSQLTETVQDIYVDYKRNLRGMFCGFSIMKNGKKEKVSYLFDLYKGEINVGGTRTLLGKEEIIKEGYEVRSFKLEENCNTNVLMTPNAHFAGKTLLSLGILDKSTNKVIYFQQELECNYDEIFNYAREIPVPTPETEEDSNSISTYDTKAADALSLASMETDYVVLRESTPAHVMLDNPQNTYSLGEESNPGLSLIDSEEMPIESRLTENNEMTMGDFLDVMEENGGYNSNVQPRYIVAPVPDMVFRTGPFWEFQKFSNFSYASVPYAYFAYAMQGPVAQIRHTQIVVFDITYIKDGNDLALQIEIRNAGWVAYNSRTNDMKFYKVNRAGVNCIQIISAKSYFQSRDSEGVFWYRKYSSYRGGWVWNTSKLQTAAVGWASYALGFGWLGPLNSTITALSKGESKENIPYYYPQTKKQQKEKYEGDQISEINATWGGNNNYFYRPGDYWVLESKRDNMREWIAGFEITAKMDIYVF